MDDKTFVDLIIKMIQEKSKLTDLEKDIQDTFNAVINESDKSKITNKITENRLKYLTMTKETAISLIQNPHSKLTNFDNLTIEEVRANLSNQLIVLCDQSIKENNIKLS